MEELTKLLNQWSCGDKAVESTLINIVYPIIKKISHNQLTKHSRNISDTTDIVHEAYFKLEKQGRIVWKNRGHFYSSCAMIIRRILVDHYRRQASIKRGKLNPHLPLDEMTERISNCYDFNFDVLEFDRLLDQLRQVDYEASKIVEMRYFMGLTKKEISEISQISLSKVSRDWDFARSWLVNKLTQEL